MGRPVGSAGSVILAGAPLGQAADSSGRLAAALGSCPVIAAEDTRRLRRLAAELGVQISGQVPQLLEHLRAGRDVLVITDAGMPSISDPGYRLVVAAVAAGLGVTVLPGPSAVTAALAVSGLAVDRFCFEGFLPRKSGARRSALSELAAERRTMVFFESPHRLGDCLTDMVEVFGGQRRAAVCRELTKTYEQILRGPLSELAEWATGEVLGEITVVLGGADITVIEPTDLAGEVSRRELAGVSRRDAIADVAREAGVAKRTVYDAVLVAKASSGP
jgi:16S rRNA (cytidine1402-2'-O)-methyltransferase